MAEYKRTDHGMTLLEILVAVIIVATLATIAVPAYNSYIDRANMVATQALIDNLAVAAEAYYSAYREYPPSGSDTLRRAILGLPPFPPRIVGSIPAKHIAPRDWRTKDGPSVLQTMGFYDGTKPVMDYYYLPEAAVDNEVRPILDAWGRPIIYIRDTVLRRAFRRQYEHTTDGAEWLSEWAHFGSMVSYSDQRSYPLNYAGGHPTGTYLRPHHMDKYQMYSFGLNGYTRPPINETTFGAGPAGPGSLLWDNGIDDDGDGRVDFAQDNSGRYPALPLGSNLSEDNIMNR